MHHHPHYHLLLQSSFPTEHEPCMSCSSCIQGLAVCPGVLSALWSWRMAVKAQNISSERLLRLSAYKSPQKCCGFDSRVRRCFVALSNLSFLGARTQGSIIKPTFTGTTWAIFSSPAFRVAMNVCSSRTNACLIIYNVLIKWEM